MIIADHELSISTDWFIINGLNGVIDMEIIAVHGMDGKDNRDYHVPIMEQACDLAGIIDQTTPAKGIVSHTFPASAIWFIWN